MREQVTVTRPATTTDRYGDQVADWSSTTDTVVEECIVAPGPSGELADARAGVVTAITVYMPAGIDVAAHDRLVVRGAIYDVEGTPAVWSSPFTSWAPGVEVQARRVEG